MKVQAPLQKCPVNVLGQVLVISQEYQRRQHLELATQLQLTRMSSLAMLLFTSSAKNEHLLIATLYGRPEFSPKLGSTPTVVFGLQILQVVDIYGLTNDVPLTGCFVSQQGVALCRISLVMKGEPNDHTALFCLR